METIENYENLKKRVERIKSWIPFTMGELLRMKLPKDLFLVENLIPEQGLAVLSGNPENCKSWALLHIAQCVATGEPVFGKFKVKKGNVLIFDEESGLYEACKRIQIIKPKFATKVFIFLDKGIKVDNPEHIENIIKIIQEKNIKLVIFDPFISIHNKSENSSDEMQRVIEALRKLTVEGATVLFAHHNRKEQASSKKTSSQNMRGSSAIWAGVNSHIDLIKTNENDKDTILIFNPSKLKNDKKIKPFKIKMVVENKTASFDYIGESLENISQREKVEGHILRKLIENKELKIEDLIDKSLAGKGLFVTVSKQLKAKKLITSKKVARGREMFSMANN